MLTELKNFLGMGETVEPDYRLLLKSGAVILDVRSEGEYSGGHIHGSVNIPVDKLNNCLQRLKNKNQAVITCCASGVRSARARSFLLSNGYSNVHNGGGWYSLNQKIAGR